MAKIYNDFDDYMKNKISNRIGINPEEYRELIFNAGYKLLQDNKKYKSYFTKTGTFWDCFSHHVQFINLQIIVEDKFYEQLNDGKCSIDNVYDYFEMITQSFDLPKRSINLINKQYQIYLDNLFIVKNDGFKPLIIKRKVSTYKKRKNQIELNLNTI